MTTRQEQTTTEQPRHDRLLPGPSSASHVRTGGPSGFDGLPWPQFLDGHPVVVVPASPARPVLAAEGWSDNAHALDLHPGWSAVLDGQRLAVRRPGGELWFEESLLLTREWRRAAHVHRHLLLTAGPFSTIGEFPSAAEAGALRLLVVAVTFAGETW